MHALDDPALGIAHRCARRARISLGHAEVSGVCTASDARGGGLAEAVVRAVASQLQARGDLPFLHVQVGSVSQATATALYERLGFRERPGAGGER